MAARTAKKAVAQRARPRQTRFDIPLELLRMPRTGRAYDLSSGWWPGMPLAAGHPPFRIMTYRTPAGERNQKDLRFLDQNRVNFGFVSEFMMGTTHTGTHIDALAHITCGPHAAGRRLQFERAPRRFRPAQQRRIGTAAAVQAGPPPRHPGGARRRAPGSPSAGWAERARGGLQRPGRGAGGRSRSHPHRHDARLAKCGGPRRLRRLRLSLEGAEWLARRGVAAFAGDNAALEVAPSGIKGDPQPLSIAF